MQLFLSSACQSLSLLVCLWFFLFSSFDALFVLLYPIIISLLTFLCIIKPQTKCSATLNRWLARPEKGGEKNGWECWELQYLFSHNTDSWQSRLWTERCITTGWLWPLQQVLRFAIQRCSVYSTILMLIQESSGEKRVKQQCMFLMRLGDEGSDFMSCFLPADTPERHEFLCRQGCQGAHPYSSVDPRNHDFTSVQLIGSNSSSFQTASKSEDKKVKKVKRVGSR